MTTDNVSKFLSKEAAADLSAKQYHCVALDSDGKIAAITASTDLPFGVLYNTPVTGEIGQVAPIGGLNEVKIESSATIDEAAQVSIDAVGAAAASTSGNYDIGICTKGGADGELISVLTNNLVVKA